MTYVTKISLNLLLIAPLLSVVNCLAYNVKYQSAVQHVYSHSNNSHALSTYSPFEVLIVNNSTTMLFRVARICQTCSVEVSYINCNGPIFDP